MYHNEISGFLARAKEIILLQNRRTDKVLRKNRSGDRLHDKNLEQELPKNVRPYSNSQGHWFEANAPKAYVRKQKIGSNSWYRLQAFIQTHSDEELQAIDPTWSRDEVSRFA